MELQETRRYILEILKQHGECTVDEIVDSLSSKLQRGITTVTVRHHLERLRAENLVNPPQIRRRSTPGRPQYVYSLTEKAFEYFPNNYASFADNLLKQVKHHFPDHTVNVILEDMAGNMATSAAIPADAPLRVRLMRVVDHLNEQGYVASWEHIDGGYLLTTTNCPYERIADNHEEICGFDLQFMTRLLGVVPRFVGNLRGGHECCQYFIPAARTG